MRYEKDKLLSITRAGAVCALCGESLEKEAKHLSMLVESAGKPEEEKPEGPAADMSSDSEEEGPEMSRSDYHQACWAKVAKGDYLSFWLARRPEPPETPKMSKQERNTVLLGLFSALMKSNEPVDDPAKFILSHLLMKYRALVLKGARLDENSRKWILFTLPQTEEEYEIPDIVLTDEQMADTLRKITEYLEKAQSDAVIVAEDEAKGDERSED